MDLWPFSPLIFMLPPSDVSCHPLCRCCSEERPWALPGAQDRVLPQGTARCPRGVSRARGGFRSRGWYLQSWAVDCSIWPKQAFLKTYLCSDSLLCTPYFLGRHFAATLRVGGMTQPGTGETAPEAQKPGQPSLICPCLCLQNLFFSPHLWYLNPDKDGALGGGGFPLLPPPSPPPCHHCVSKFSWLLPSDVLS